MIDELFYLDYKVDLAEPEQVVRMIRSPGDRVDQKLGYSDIGCEFVAEDTLFYANHSKAPIYMYARNSVARKIEPCDNDRFVTDKTGEQFKDREVLCVERKHRYNLGLTSESSTFVGNVNELYSEYEDSLADFETLDYEPGRIDNRHKRSEAYRDTAVQAQHGIDLDDCEIFSHAEILAGKPDLARDLCEYEYYSLETLTDKNKIYIPGADIIVSKVPVSRDVIDRMFDVRKENILTRMVNVYDAEGSLGRSCFDLRVVINLGEDETEHTKFETVYTNINGAVHQIKPVRTSQISVGVHVYLNGADEFHELTDTFKLSNVKLLNLFDVAHEAEKDTVAYKLQVTVDEQRRKSAEADAARAVTNREHELSVLEMKRELANTTAKHDEEINSLKLEAKRLETAHEIELARIKEEAAKTSNEHDVKINQTKETTATIQNDTARSAAGSKESGEWIKFLAVAVTAAASIFGILYKLFWSN